MAASIELQLQEAGNATSYIATAVTTQHVTRMWRHVAHAPTPSWPYASACKAEHLRAMTEQGQVVCNLYSKLLNDQRNLNHLAIRSQPRCDEHIISF